jgi:hypothetical protein
VTGDEVRVVDELDDGKFLLVSIDLEPGAEVRTLGRIRADIRGIRKSKIAPRPADYAWTAVIKKRGTVVDSLMGGCSGKLPEG